MKFTTILIAAVAGITGYILGSRAGRRRYREIRSGAKRAWNSRALKKTVKRTEKGLKRAAKKIRR